MSRIGTKTKHTNKLKTRTKTDRTGKTRTKTNKQETQGGGETYQGNQDKIKQNREITTKTNKSGKKKQEKS